MLHLLHFFTYPQTLGQCVLILICELCLNEPCPVFAQVRGCPPTCVTWKETKWVEGNCKCIQINSKQTKCSCVHPGTFALIMQTSGPSEVRDNERQFQAKIITWSSSIVRDLQNFFIANEMLSDDAGESSSSFP